MKNSNLFVLLTLFVLAGLVLVFYYTQAETINVTATVEGCGNEIIEGSEQCDKANLNNQTCVSRGFTSGTLTCNSNCIFNTSSCSSGGGSGGGAYIPPPVVTIVIFEGRAYPKSPVTLLKDAQIATTTIAGSDANFQINISGLAGGNYIFSVYSEDKEGRRSSLLSFLVSVTAGATTKVSGIFIAPTIAIDKSEVKRGENIAISGQSAPEAKIQIFIKSEEKEFSVDTTANKDGEYNYSLNTSSLDFGEYQVTVVASINNISSNVSRIINFIVGTKTVFKKRLPECSLISDFNKDCRVNLIDFSILIYWFGRFEPPAEIDLDGNRQIDLVDFSIMAYYWTG